MNVASTHPELAQAALVPASAAVSGCGMARETRTLGARRILLVGDSVLAGALVVDGPRIVKEVGTCVVDILRSKLPGFEFHVDAIPLRRVSDLLPALPALLDRVRPEVLVLALGGNDADIDWRRFIVSGGERVRSNTPLDRYIGTLGSLFEIAASQGVRTVLVEVIGSQMRPRAGHLSQIASMDLGPIIERSGGQPRVDGIVRTYREQAAKVALAHGVVVAPVGSLMDTHGERAVGPDGTHLNDHGHQVMADVLASCLIPLLAAASA